MDTMKPISKAALQVFRKLATGLKEPGTANKIDNAKGAFMAVSIDLLQRHHHGPAGTYELYAVAHRYELNGDLVPDPDVEFLAVRDHTGAVAAVYPLAIDHGMGRYRRHAWLKADLTPDRLAPAAQKDLATFCSVWFKNIKEQQGL